MLSYLQNLDVINTSDLIIRDIKEVAGINFEAYNSSNLHYEDAALVIPENDVKLQQLLDIVATH